jgi:hypothetical protein
MKIGMEGGRMAARSRSSAASRVLSSAILMSVCVMVEFGARRVLYQHKFYCAALRQGGCARIDRKF